MKDVVLWVYIGLLLVGGLMGFLKAQSKVSLISAVVFAVLLGLCAAHLLNVAWLAEGFLLLLIAVFGIRLGKTKKFIPSGLMLAVTAMALVLRFAVA
ncbi:MAG: TMEM14 family protein [Verrucomicrobia bacterium]|nr:TMEM14 family protein [Verrucomicrobiota bacterium]